MKNVGLTRGEGEMGGEDPKKGPVGWVQRAGVVRDLKDAGPRGRRLEDKNLGEGGGA